VMLSHHTEGDHFAGYDGNGNVMGLISGATKTLSATYEYGPFGEVIQMTGTMASVNPFRFSTKYQDDETGMNYYGFRYYNAGTGRWLSKDPIGERGGLNLYSFVDNRCPNSIDPLGLETSSGQNGTWEFIIRNASELNERPVVDVSFTMDESLACRCREYKIWRYAYSAITGRRFLDGSVDAGLAGYSVKTNNQGWKVFPASAEPDQPGGGIANVLALEFKFDWEARCTKGPLKDESGAENVILSILSRTIVIMGSDFNPLGMETVFPPVPGAER
jgi:RHS repeat-associated protein